jgi:hypothetical protein
MSLYVGEHHRNFPSQTTFEFALQLAPAGICSFLFFLKQKQIIEGWRWGRF